jgi:hypothetical protein
MVEARGGRCARKAECFKVDMVEQAPLRNSEVFSESIRHVTCGPCPLPNFLRMQSRPLHSRPLYPAACFDFDARISLMPVVAGNMA